MSKKIYYHISVNLEETERFIPRVPLERLEGEDAEIPRICVCTDIDNCIAAFPNAIHFRKFNECYDEHVLLRIYEFHDLSDEIIIPPISLQHLVPDALINEEYWITEEIKPTVSYIVEVIDFDFLQRDKNLFTYQLSKLDKKTEKTFSNPEIPIHFLATIHYDGDMLKEDEVDFVKSSILNNFSGEKTTIKATRIDDFSLEIEGILDTRKEGRPKDIEEYLQSYVFENYFDLETC